MLLTIIIFLVILTILVLIHELGHFLVAKKLGIRVEEFGFGLPPRAFGIKRGETVYSINWLPIGGFVKLYGEDLPAEATHQALQAGEARSGEIRNYDKGRAFFYRSVWQRTAVVVAGVLMNFILAVLVISYIFTQGIAIPTEKVHIVDILEDSPAQKAGLQKDDVILTIDGQTVKTTQDLIAITKEKAGKEVILTIEREKMALVIIPRKEYPQDQGPMGIVISNVEMKKYPLILAPIYGTAEAVRLSWLVVKGLGVIFWQGVILGQAPQGVAGPVGIAQLTGQVVQFGPLAVISFLGLLSLNLAILNILPIPALDGGRLFFIFLEVVLRRRINPHFERYTHTIGMALLLALLALVTFRDLTRVFSGQPILPTP